MPLVKDPNCDGRGWVPLYTGRKNDDGTPEFSGTIPDPRCNGTGVIDVPEVWPASLTEYYAEETAAGIPNARAYEKDQDGVQEITGP